MTTELCWFTANYQGRHAPEDALWWYHHPDSPGPTGAPPTQWAFIDAADRLERDGHAEAANAMLEALAALLTADRQATRDALERLRRSHDR